MSNRLRTAAFAVAACIPLSLLAPGVAGATGGGYYPPPPPPPSYGNEGCTPGYWKNHTSAWDVYSPSTTLGQVFTNTGTLSSRTFAQALAFGGGSSLTAAKQILLRAAVAALLNAVDGDVDYSLSGQQVITRVNRALASNNRSTILNLANNLDTRNNAGCPL
jgi:hypothetical protein